MQKNNQYNQYSDEMLMRKIGKGDDKAFTELYGRYHLKMYHYFLKMFFYKKEKAQDFMQELFLKIIENPLSFNPEYSFPHWVYTVASNMCKNEFRRISTHKVLLRTQELIEQPDFQFFNEQEEYPLFQEKLKKALTTLDIKHKQCFVLRYQEGFSIEEVSLILNCPEGTVKSRLFYCLKKLSKQLSSFQIYINDGRN